jgi:hypothetical protein
LRIKRNEATTQWRKLFNYEVHNLYLSSNSVSVIISWRLKKARQVAHLGKNENYTMHWMDNTPWETKHRCELERIICLGLVITVIRVKKTVPNL